MLGGDEVRVDEHGLGILRLDGCQHPGELRVRVSLRDVVDQQRKPQRSSGRPLPFEGRVFVERRGIPQDRDAPDPRSRVLEQFEALAGELAGMLEVAEAMAHSALARRESRGAHMRLDGYETRDDQAFLRHSLAFCQGDAAPRVAHAPVTITRLPPRARVYGGAGKQAELT